MNAYFFAITIPPLDFKPSDILITLLDEADQPVAIWNVVQAYPLKWSVTDLKATENSIMIETIELAYQYFERKM
jgi:phage tail-like protein